jgi:hypothetical protein
LLSKRSKLENVSHDGNTNFSNISICSELTSIPGRLGLLWTSTRDRVLRKYNLPLNNYHRYGLHFNIKNNYSQLFLFILLAGDVATNPGPSKPVKCVSLNAHSLKSLHNTDNNNLKVLYLNARSIKSFITIGNSPSNKVCKITLLQEPVHAGDYEVICICQTWLNKTVLDSELLLGFNTFWQGIF